jgi:hypothetical protein
MTTDTTLIQRIKDLTARFGKGWHDGIQIDASDIADLCLAADALEQQAADLAYVKAASVFNLMEENKRQAAQIEALRADAETYRAALNVIAERQNSDWPDRCQALVNIARAAVRQEQPT